jgi:hypothetical protein
MQAIFHDRGGNHADVNLKLPRVSKNIRLRGCTGFPVRSYHPDDFLLLFFGDETNQAASSGLILGLWFD